MITQIHHKRNELFEVKFYKDKECTKTFDFTGKKNLYIELKDGDLTSLFYLNSYLVNQDLRINNLMIPHIANDENILYDIDDILKMRVNKIYTIGNDAVSSLELECIVSNAIPNLSKYIPEDNAVLFLSEEDKMRFYVNEFSQKVFSKTPLVSQYRIDKADFPRNIVYGHFNDNNSSYTLNGKQKGVHPIYRKITIFIPHGTHSELQKANEVAKELKEKYGVEEVNLFMLHCFVNQDFILNIYGNSLEDSCLNEEVFCNINKIITTNSTGILRPKDSSGRLQVIDCKEIFEEYLKENNN